MSDTELTLAQHRDRFRGRCALALEFNAKIARELANAIRISPMQGCADVGTINACRKHMGSMAEWLNWAEESGQAIRAAEALAGKPAARSSGRPHDGGRRPPVRADAKSPKSEKEQ